MRAQDTICMSAWPNGNCPEFFAVSMGANGQSGKTCLEGFEKGFLAEVLSIVQAIWNSCTHTLSLSAGIVHQKSLMSLCPIFELVPSSG